VRRLVLLVSCVLWFGLAQGAASQEAPPPVAPPPEGLQQRPEQLQLLPVATATAAELEEQGDNLRARNLHLDALDSYQAALRKQSSAVLYNKLGITYVLLRHPADAMAAINRAIKMQKNYADAWNNRASVYYMSNEFGRAIKDYRHAIKLNDKNASYHSNLGSAYFNKHQFEKAAREYQVALQLDPFVFERSSRTGIAALMGKPGDRAEFEYMMAKLFAQNGDPANCISHLKKAIEEGYKNINNVYKDQEFAAVRTDQRFKDLMSQKPEAIQQ